MILEQNAPAKVNLGLHVLRKRADGYHDIETVFLPVSWHDHITMTPAADVQFSCSDGRLPVDDTNLCVRAVRLLSAYVHEANGVSIHLEKRIPFGAGLGGGSSDAASTLRMLHELWNLNLDEAELDKLALQLGADVPFFLRAKPMFATGLGEQLTPMVNPDNGLAYHFPFDLLIAVPSIHVATADAYRLITPNADGRPDIREIVCSNDLVHWRSSLKNDFELSVFEAYPKIGEIKKQMYDLGAGYASMSGSGAAVFGIFTDHKLLLRASSYFNSQNMMVWYHNQES